MLSLSAVAVASPSLAASDVRGSNTTRMRRRKGDRRANAAAKRRVLAMAMVGVNNCCLSAVGCCWPLAMHVVDTTSYAVPMFMYVGILLAKS